MINLKNAPSALSSFKKVDKWEQVNAGADYNTKVGKIEKKWSWSW